MRRAYRSIVLAFLLACSSADEPGPSGSGTGATNDGNKGGTNSSVGSPSSSGGTSSSGGSGAGAPSHDGGANSSSGSGSSSGGSGSGSGSSSGGPGGGGADAASPQSGPTWTKIYSSYLASGTIGRCDGCHAEASSASGTYSFIQGYHYFNGTQSNLSTLFSWMGGTMPPGGPSSNAQATADVQAWVAAGALND